MFFEHFAVINYTPTRVAARDYEVEPRLEARRTDDPRRRFNLEADQLRNYARSCGAVLREKRKG
jgi:hypothetical protein